MYWHLGRSCEPKNLKNAKKVMVAKALEVSGTRCPYVSVSGWEVVRGAAAPKGPMTYAVFIRTSRIELEPGGYFWGLKAEIWALRLGFEPQGWDFSLEAGIWALRLGFGARDYDLSLGAGISALRLRFELWGFGLSLEAGVWASRGGDGRRRRRRRRRNFPYVWKHRSSAPLGPLPCALP